MAESSKYRSTIQSEQILALLRAAHGAWVPLSEILALGIAQYNARIFELRKQGLTIENRTEVIGDARRSWFRLVDSPDAPDSTPKPETSAPVDFQDRPRSTGLPLWDSAGRR